MLMAPKRDWMIPNNDETDAVLTRRLKVNVPIWAGMCVSYLYEEFRLAIQCKLKHG